MRKTTFKIHTLVVLGILGTALCAAAAEYGPENFSAAGRMYQPAPSGHVPGKDNGPGTGLHNAGEDCGLCHRPGGKAQNYIFTIAGTFYQDRAARRTAEGGEIILQDIGGNVISMTSNSVGNFWSYTPFASNPYSIASHSGTTVFLYTDTEPADPSDSRTWQYKGWVKNGDQTTPMVTIAPVGGSTDPSSRMSCNMHHSALGSRGGLWGSRKSTLDSYPAEGMSFQKHILPIFVSKCVPCHIPGSTMTRLVTKSDAEDPSTSIDYSNGQDFTAYAGSTVSSVEKKGIAYFALDFAATPDESPLLTKTVAGPAGEFTHAGGYFWSAEDPDYKAIRQWIAEGSPDN
jgi:hypothetical protein